MSEDLSTTETATVEPSANETTTRSRSKGLWIGLAFVAALVLLVALNMR